MAEQTPDSGAFSRRDALRRAGVLGGAAGLVWATPAITTLGGAAFAVGSAAGTTYDLVSSFGGHDNPAGQFSFRKDSALLQLKSNAFSTSGLPDVEGGNNATSGSTYPFVAKNTGGAPVVAPSGAPGVVVPPGAVFLHPDNSGDPLVVRFTAPGPGTYTATGFLRSIDSGGGDGVQFVFGSTAGSVTPGGGPVPLSGSFTPGLGGFVDLEISCGGGGYSFDSTQISLTFSSQ